LRAWRFHRAIYDPLDTTGSHTYGGRWNPKGVPVVYASLSFAGGLLELIAHISVPRRPPRGHVASLIEVPEDAGVASLQPSLPVGWDHPDDFGVARGLTRPWLEDGTDLCLLVPSVPGAPVERNLVINARHPRFTDIVIVEKVGSVYDPRVWG
jgi:RES domain-containing protein